MLGYEEEMAIETFHLRGSKCGYSPLEMHSLGLLEMESFDVVYLPWTQLDGGVIEGLELKR